MIFNRVFFIIAFSIFIAGSAFANSLFDQANEAFSKNNYLEAVNLYEQFSLKKGHSASLYFNIANSYAQLGENGKAVLNYERALRLSPNNADIIKNFSYFKEEAGLFLDEQSILDKLLNLLSPNQWSYLTLAFLVATSLTIIFWKKLATGSTPRAVVSLFIFCLLTSASGLAAAQTYLSAPTYVVIKDVKMMVSPFEDAKPKGLIKSGKTASVGKKYKTYVHIEDETGQQGWVKSNNLEAVILK